MRTSGYQTFEIVAVVITALLKFLFYDILDQRLVFILIMFAFWGIYVFQRVRKYPRILFDWGFRTDNIKLVLKKVWPFGLISLIVCIGIGSLQNTINLHWHILPILITYPLFGILQQFLLMALVAGNMQSQQKHSDLAIIVITSVLFAVVHYPYHWLIVGTFILSLFYAYLYLKHRNLYVLGIFHGWLGAIFYYTVVDQDPFVEVFGQFLK